MSERWTDPQVTASYLSGDPRSNSALAPDVRPFMEISRTTFLAILLLPRGHQTWNRKQTQEPYTCSGKQT